MARFNDPLVALPLTALSAALRSVNQQIVQTWENLAGETIPTTRSLPAQEIRAALSTILSRLADALEAPNPDAARGMIRDSVSGEIGGLWRNYSVDDLNREDRLLRQAIVRQVELALGRPLNKDEEAALQGAIDFLLQQAVAELVGHQQRRLRAAAGADLTDLRFLSDDLSNNLSHVMVWLQMLTQRPSGIAEVATDMAMVDAIQQSILDTVGEMGRLLEAKRLDIPPEVPNPPAAATRRKTTRRKRSSVPATKEVGVRPYR